MLDVIKQKLSIKNTMKVIDVGYSILKLYRIVEWILQWIP